MIARREWIALGAAGLVAVAMPALLLRPGVAPPEPVVAPPSPPLAPPVEPVLGVAFERPLFSAAPAAPIDAAPGDAPALVGIVGRLDQDAVALVRSADGNSRTLKVGESVDGWRLEALALDAASFVRGNERRRVPLPVE